MLEVRDVTKRYGALTAVSGVSLTVRPGEVLGYLGPNGSGKSTTVKMLAGLMRPTAGHIFFDGRDIQEELEAHKARVGYVPEEAHVYTYLYKGTCNALPSDATIALNRRVLVPQRWTG